MPRRRGAVVRNRTKFEVLSLRDLIRFKTSFKVNLIEKYWPRTKMTTLRPFRAEDLFKFNHINLDPLTETYNNTFYMQYLATWPSLCAAYENTSGRMMGYVLGKAEGNGKLWHGHVTAVTVSPEFRRLGVAKKLMFYLEDVSTRTYNAYFVDLFVRASNLLAQLMYENLNYVKYRRVTEYYSGEEDAFDMRKALVRDKKKESVVPRVPFECSPDEIEWN